MDMSVLVRDVTIKFILMKLIIYITLLLVALKRRLVLYLVALNPNSLILFLVGLNTLMIYTTKLEKPFYYGATMGNLDMDHFMMP